MRIRAFSILTAMTLIVGCGKRPDGAEAAKEAGSPPPTAAETQSDAQSSNATLVATEPGSEETDHASVDHGPGKSMGGRGMGRGGGFRPDMTTIHAMFAVKEKIKRTVNPLPTGAEAITESDDADITSLIQEHVPAMETRVMDNAPLPPMTFHPVFQSLIKHAEDYTLEYEDTDKGIKVTYKAKDPFVIMLVQEHAKLVSRFLKNGMSEIHKPYELPKLNDTDRAGKMK